VRNIYGFFPEFFFHTTLQQKRSKCEEYNLLRYFRCWEIHQSENTGKENSYKYSYNLCAAVPGFSNHKILNVKKLIALILRVFLFILVCTMK